MLVTCLFVNINMEELFIVLNLNWSGFNNSREIPYPLLQYSDITDGERSRGGHLYRLHSVKEPRYKSVGVPKQSRSYYARNSVKIAPRRYDIFSLRKESTGGRFRLGIGGNSMTAEREKVGNYERLIGGNDWMEGHNYTSKKMGTFLELKYFLDREIYRLFGKL